MPRTRKTAPAPEPEVAETEETAGSKRGPNELTTVFVGWLKDTYGVDADPEVVYLAQTTRREFRESDAYQDYLEAAEERKEAAAKAKAERAQAAAAAAEETTSEEPAKPTTRSRSRKAAAAPAGAEADAPAEAAKPAPRTRTRKAPF